MSKFLYVLGKWVFTHRLRALAIWLALLAILGGLAFNYSKPYSTEITIPGTPAISTLEKISDEFPEANNSSGTVVFKAKDGSPITQHLAEIERVITKLSKTEGVGRVVSPAVSKTISPDGNIAFAQVQLTTQSQDLSPKVRDAVVQTVDDARSDTLQVEVRGDFMQQVPTVGSHEVIGVLIACLVLVITFGSLLAAGMPLLVALAAVGAGMLAVTLASGFVDISSTTPILAIMLGLAVGIDYSLFLIVRYIKYLKEGATPKEAVARAVATAGNAVIFAALTVVIALAALLIVGVPFLGSMGVFAALTVAFAAVSAITLLPALLGFLGDRVLPKNARLQYRAGKFIDADKVKKTGFAFKWVRAVTRYPAMVAIIVVLGLGALAVPASKLYLGLPDDGAAVSSSTERKAYDLLSEGFGPGFNGPLLVVANLPELNDPRQVQSAVGAITANLIADEQIVSAVPAGISENGRTAIFQAYPTTGPNDQATRDLIASLRDSAQNYAETGADIEVTGQTAVAVDVDEKLTEALPRYLLVVVGLSLLVLLAVFRSVLVPLKATLGFVLTIVATLGLLVIFFQWGWLGLVDPGPILSFLPILVTGILFGLAMDYQFFLVSGMHEEFARTKKAKESVVNGYALGARVVVAAAIIMISVFAGFIFTHDTMIRSIGFALAVGVFIDAFIVRMTLVPAIMHLFGKHAWWLPSWLGRIIPNLSIEGDETIFERSAKPRRKL